MLISLTLRSSGRAVLSRSCMRPQPSRDFFSRVFAATSFRPVVVLADLE